MLVLVLLVMRPGFTDLNVSVCFRLCFLFLLNVQVIMFVLLGMLPGPADLNICVFVCVVGVCDVAAVVAGVCRCEHWCDWCRCSSCWSVQM